MVKLRNKMKPNFSDEYLENLSKIWLMKVAKWIIQFIYLLKGPYNEKRRVLFFDMLQLSDTSFLLHIISCSASQAQALQSNLFIWQFSQHQKHVCNKRCFVKTGFFWFGIISSSSSVFKLIFFYHLTLGRARRTFGPSGTLLSGSRQFSQMNSQGSVLLSYGNKKKPV